MCLFVLISLCLLASSFTKASTKNSGVRYKLRADKSTPGVIEVSLSFKLVKGEKVLLEPDESGGTGDENLAAPVVDFRVQKRPEYLVVPSKSGVGLIITANGDTGLEVPYRVSFKAGNPTQRSGEAYRNAKPSLPVILPDLQVFKASQVLICPRRLGTRSAIGNGYSIQLMPGAGQTVLTPWEKTGHGYMFRTNGETSLLENYVAMGRMKILEKKRGNCSITVGFTADHQGLTPQQRQVYADDLAALFAQIKKTMGTRRELPRLSILVAGVERYGLKQPSASGLFSSVLTFNGAKSMRGNSVSISSASIFELWNKWVIVPSQKGGGLWFQNGIQQFYAYRAAAEAGMLGSNEAYREFSQLYLDYVSDPLSLSTSIANAEGSGDAPSLLQEKGAVLCASLAKRLSEQTKGEKDVDWLLGELARRFDHFKGTTYTMVDITELLEGATGKSWDRFFNERLNGTRLLSPSEFSTSDLFGTGSNGVDGKKLEVKGSGKSWLIILVAVLFLFLIPLIFGAYVRRSVKLDLTMPRILPEEEEENGQEKQDDS